MATGILTRIRNGFLAADLLKVGPKGYVHGWIFVGAPGVHAHVFHPKHGAGRVTHHDEHGHVHVAFDSGKTRSFAHNGTPGGTGALGRRKDVAGGHDKFSQHLAAASAANRRKDYAGAANAYRNAAGETSHPKIRAEMHGRADTALGKIPAGAGRTPTSREFAATDASGAAHNLGQLLEHDDPTAAKKLHVLRDDLRTGKVDPAQAANEIERIAAEHPGDSHAHWQLATAGAGIRGDQRYGHIMATPPRPSRAPRKTVPKPPPVRDVPPTPEGRRVGPNGEILDTGWVELTPQKRPPTTPAVPGPATAVGHHRAAEERDIAAFTAGQALRAHQASPIKDLPGRRGFGAHADQARKLNEQQIGHQRAAAAHRAEAAKLRAQGTTPEDRATVGEMFGLAHQATTEGRHADAARIWDARAARLRAGDTGWTLGRLGSGKDPWILHGGKKDNAYQGFTSRKKAEEWRNDAGESMAQTAEAEARAARRRVEAAVAPPPKLSSERTPEALHDNADILEARAEEDIKAGRMQEAWDKRVVATRMRHSAERMRAEQEAGTPTSKHAEHLAAADAALATGDRAGAINHLMVAAQHAPTTAEAQHARDRHTVLAAEEMGVPVPKDVARRLADGPTYVTPRPVGTAVRAPYNTAQLDAIERAKTRSGNPHLRLNYQERLSDSDFRGLKPEDQQDLIDHVVAVRDRKSPGEEDVKTRAQALLDKWHGLSGRGTPAAEQKTPLPLSRNPRKKALQIAHNDLLPLAVNSGVVQPNGDNLGRYNEGLRQRLKTLSDEQLKALDDHSRSIRVKDMGDQVQEHRELGHAITSEVFDRRRAARAEVERLKPPEPPATDITPPPAPPVRVVAEHATPNEGGGHNPVLGAHKPPEWVHDAPNLDLPPVDRNAPKSNQGIHISPGDIVSVGQRGERTYAGQDNRAVWSVLGIHPDRGTVRVVSHGSPSADGWSYNKTWGTAKRRAAIQKEWPISGLHHEESVTDQEYRRVENLGTRSRDDTIHQEFMSHPAPVRAALTARANEVSKELRPGAANAAWKHTLDEHNRNEMIRHALRTVPGANKYQVTHTYDDNGDEVYRFKPREKGDYSTSPFTVIPITRKDDHGVYDSKGRQWTTFASNENGGQSRRYAHAVPFAEAVNAAIDNDHTQTRSNPLSDMHRLRRRDKYAPVPTMEPFTSSKSPLSAEATRVPGPTSEPGFVDRVKDAPPLAATAPGVLTPEQHDKEALRYDRTATATAPNRPADRPQHERRMQIVRDQAELHRQAATDLRAGKTPLVPVEERVTMADLKPGDHIEVHRGVGGAVPAKKNEPGVRATVTGVRPDGAGLHVETDKGPLKAGQKPRTAVNRLGRASEATAEPPSSPKPAEPGFVDRVKDTGPPTKPAGRKTDTQAVRDKLTAAPAAYAKDIAGNKTLESGGGGDFAVYKKPRDGWDVALAADGRRLNGNTFETKEQAHAFANAVKDIRHGDGTPVDWAAPDVKTQAVRNGRTEQFSQVVRRAEVESHGGSRLAELQNSDARQAASGVRTNRMRELGYTEQVAAYDVQPGDEIAYEHAADLKETPDIVRGRVADQSHDRRSAIRLTSGTRTSDGGATKELATGSPAYGDYGVATAPSGGYGYPRIYRRPRQEGFQDPAAHAGDTYEVRYGKRNASYSGHNVVRVEPDGRESTVHNTAGTEAHAKAIAAQMRRELKTGAPEGGREIQDREHNALHALATRPLTSTGYTSRQGISTQAINTRDLPKPLLDSLSSSGHIGQFASQPMATITDRGRAYLAAHAADAATRDAAARLNAAHDARIVADAQRKADQDAKAKAQAEADKVKADARRAKDAARATAERQRTIAKPTAGRRRPAGEAQRGDLIVTEHTRRDSVIGKPSTETKEYRVHRVASVDRNGMATSGHDLAWGSDGAPQLTTDKNGILRSGAYPVERRWIVPKETVDAVGVQDALRAHTYPGSTTPMPHDDLKAVTALIRPHTTGAGATARATPVSEAAAFEKASKRIRAAGDITAQRRQLDTELARADLPAGARAKLEDIKAQDAARQAARAANDPTQQRAERAKAEVDETNRVMATPVDRTPDGMQRLADDLGLTVKTVGTGEQMHSQFFTRTPGAYGTPQKAASYQAWNDKWSSANGSDITQEQALAHMGEWTKNPKGDVLHTQYEADRKFRTARGADVAAQELSDAVARSSRLWAELQARQKKPGQ